MAVRRQAASEKTRLTIRGGVAPARGLALNVVDRLADGADALRLLVRDGDLELSLQLHHQLDDVERVCTDVVLERRVARDLLAVDAEVIANDLDHPFFNRA